MIKKTSRPKVITLFILLCVLAFFCRGWWLHNLSYCLPVRNASVHASGEKHRLLFKPKNPKLIRVLVLSGGGVRGLVSLEVLKAIEKKAHEPIADLFDLFVGTSTGAIAEASLLKPNEKGQPEYTTGQVIEFYHSLSKEVFRRSWVYRLETLNGLLGPKYPSEQKYQIFNNRFKGLEFNQLIKPMLIPTYSLNSAIPIQFSNWGKESYRYYVKDLLMAATAPPTIFRPIYMHVMRRDHDEELVDGAIYANNPSLIALGVVLSRFPHAKYVFVHVGTGIKAPHLQVAQVSHWGLFNWSTNIMNVVLNANSINADKTMEYTDSHLNTLRYVDFNSALPEKLWAIDDTSKGTQRALKKFGRSIVHAHQKQLDAVVKLLKRDKA